MPADFTLSEIFKGRAPDWAALRRDLRVRIQVLHPALWRAGNFTSWNPPYGSAVPGRPLVLDGIPLNVVTDPERFDPICAKAVEKLTPVITSPWAVETSVAGAHQVSRYTVPVQRFMGPLSPADFKDLGTYLSHAAALLWSALQKDYLYGAGTLLWSGQEPDELHQFYHGLWQSKDGRETASDAVRDSVDLGIAYLERARRARQHGDDDLLAECSRVAISIFDDIGAPDLARHVMAEYPDLGARWKALDARCETRVRQGDEIFSEGFAEWQSHAGLSLLANGLIEQLSSAFTPAEVSEHLRAARERQDRLSPTNPYRLGFSWLKAIEDKVGECVLGTGILVTIIAWPLSSLSRYVPVRAIEALPAESLWLPNERAATLATAPLHFDLSRKSAAEASASQPDGEGAGSGRAKGFRVGEALLTRVHEHLDATLAGIRTFSRDYVKNL